MRRVLYAEDWEARAEAYRSAADHLSLNWTDDSRERAQGMTLSRFFRNKESECRAKARKTDSVAVARS